MGKKMDLMKLIKSRRSIRSYEDRAVPDEIVGKIVEAGRWAPSAINMQPWKFIVVTSKDEIKRLSDCVTKKVFTDPLVKERIKTKSDPIFYSAPLLVIILKEENSKWSEIDCALAAENMMLYAYSVGLGSCMIGRIRMIDGKELEVPKGYSVHSSIIFGYPAEKPEPRPRKKEAVEYIS